MSVKDFLLTDYIHGLNMSDVIELDVHTLHQHSDFLNKETQDFVKTYYVIKVKSMVNGCGLDDEMLNDIALAIVHKGHRLHVNSTEKSEEHAVIGSSE